MEGNGGGVAPGGAHCQIVEGYVDEGWGACFEPGERVVVSEVVGEGGTVVRIQVG